MVWKESVYDISRIAHAGAFAFYPTPFPNTCNDMTNASLTCKHIPSISKIHNPHQPRQSLIIQYIHPATAPPPSRASKSLCTHHFPSFSTFPTSISSIQSKNHARTSSLCSLFLAMISSRNASNASRRDAARIPG